MTKQAAALSVTIDGDIITLTFGHDTANPLALSAQYLTPEIQHAAMMHGLKQKLVDAAAIPRDTETGRSATPAQKMDAVRSVLETLRAGQWNKTRATGEGSTAAGGLLYRALVRLQAGKMAPEAVKTWLAGKDKEAQAALRGNARIAAIIAEIKAEDAAKNPGSLGDDLLAELGEAPL